MSVIEGLIQKETDNTLSFGNYTLAAKSKVSDFEFLGDLYKVKTFKEITKLEKNGLFVYESVPGTVVKHFKADDKEVEFSVESYEDAQFTLELEPETEYEAYIDEISIGTVKTNLGGKLSISLSLDEGVKKSVKIVHLG